MVKINKQLVSQSVINSKSYGKGNTCEFIVIHETANTNTGAGAQAHSNLQTNGNRRQASWHFQVDDKQAIQSFNDNIRCWHAGTNGNNKGIAIEICVNRDSNYKKAVDNAISLTKILMKRHNIPTSKVKQHNYFTGKNCPTNLRNGSKGINWSQFKSRLSNTSTTPSKPSSKPVSKPTSSSKPTGKANMKTNSIVEYLQSINQPWSYSHRKSLANKHGIANYSGKSVQNKILLHAMRNGKPASKPVAKPKTSNSYPLPNGVLKRGSRGNNVRQLQRALNKANYKVGAVDGDYGIKTHDAVRRLQSMYETNAKMVDGIYGRRTKGYLSKLV